MSLPSLRHITQHTVPFFHLNNMAGVQRRTFYDVLCISQDANPDAIKTAYKRMSRQCHPDKNLGSAQAVERQQAVSSQSSSTAD